jgi:hypothetical protein
MDEFPPSSPKKRELPERAKVDQPRPEVNEKRVEKVVTGKVTRRKRSQGRQLKEIFLGAAQYVTMDVLIPAAKDMLYDAGSQGLKQMLFGEDHYRHRGRSRSRHSEYPQLTNYTRYSRHDDRPPYPPADRDRRDRKRRANHNFDDIVLATRAEGEEIIARLYDVLEKYEVATVADLYEMVGLTSDYTDEKWGWYELNRPQVRHIVGGYLLDLPRPEPLN